MKKIALFTLLVFVMMSCKSQRGADGSPGMNGGENFVILKESEYGGREAESHEVIRSQQELDALFKELGHNRMTVDFSAYNVVAVFMGQKNTGGYKITVEDVSVDDNTAHVLTKTTVPEPDGMVSMALTQPYCIASIPKAEKVEVEENPVLLEE